MIIRPTIIDSTKIIAAQSTRFGGVSATPYSSMNLGLSVNDEKENVLKNRELFFGNLGIDLNQLVISKQVHGNQVYEASNATTTEGYDALITNKPNLFLAISVADCTPVLIYDKRHNAIAAVHAGWKGTVSKIVSNTLFKMQETYGTKGVDCVAYIGACISSDHFEVGDDVATHFHTDFKKKDEQTGKHFVDLKTANKEQLTRFGVKSDNIEVSPHCTFKNEELFFSHRRDKGISGRMMAVIGIKP